MAETTTEISHHSKENVNSEQSSQDVNQEQAENSQGQTQVAAQERKTESSPGETLSDATFNSQRVFKKSSANNKLTLYLASRDLVVSSGNIDRLQGVLLVDPDYLQDKKVYGQVTLTFRYGREDEEVMGLKFCNEAVMCLAQLYPPHPDAEDQEHNTPLQVCPLGRRRLCPDMMRGISEHFADHVTTAKLRAQRLSGEASELHQRSRL